MTRQVASPPPELQQFVHSYWALARDLSTTNGFTVTPDAFVELLFCADPIMVEDSMGREPLPPCSRIGLLYAPVHLTSAGVVRCAAVRLHAWATGPLAVEHTSARGWCSLPELNDILTPVLSALREERWNDIWPLFDAALLPRLRTGTSMTSRARAFVTATPPTAVGLGGEHELSGRQIERQVRSLTQMSPKQLANLARFQRVRDRLWDRPDVSLSALAAEMGYADQAHLNRQFKKYAGVTPRQFLSQSARVRVWHQAEEKRAANVAFVQDLSKGKG